MDDQRVLDSASAAEIPAGDKTKSKRTGEWLGLGIVLSNLLPYIIIGVGGFLGANARYLVGGWAANALGTAFPYGTLIINVSGSFVIGLFLTLITGRFIAPPSARLFFAVGFLGAYTTFSTYMFESLQLIGSRALLEALANVVGSVLLGLTGVALGVVVGRLV